MKLFVCVLTVLLLFHNSAFSQEFSVKSIYRAADSIASGDFSGVIVFDMPDNSARTFVGGTANKETKEPVEEDDYFNILSLGKSLTAAVIVQLAKEGKLRLDDNIDQYLPKRNIPNQESITVKQLLGHTSGLGDYMTAEESNPLTNSDVTISKLLSMIEAQPPKAEPGKTFVYSNSGYIVLGAIIESVENKPYKRVLREKVLEPAGIEKVYFSSDVRDIKYYNQDSEAPLNDRLPPASSDGGFWFKAEDLLRFINLLYSNHFTEESRNLLFKPIHQFPDRGERKNAGLGASFLIYEYPNGFEVAGNNGGFKGSTYSAFRIMENKNGERYVAIVLTNEGGHAGSAMKALEVKIKEL